MPHARNPAYPRTGTEANAGSHLNDELDVLFAWDNAHEADTTTHGVTGNIVGTAGVQSISSKTLSVCTLVSPVVTTSLVLGDATDGAPISYFNCLREGFAAGTASIAATSVICGVSALAANVTLTILSTEIAKSGRIWHFKDETGACGNAYTIIIATEGAETIDGKDTYVLCSNYESVTIYSDGTNLFSIQS